MTIAMNVALSILTSLAQTNLDIQTLDNFRIVDCRPSQLSAMVGMACLSTRDLTRRSAASPRQPANEAARRFAG